MPHGPAFPLALPSGLLSLSLPFAAFPSVFTNSLVWTKLSLCIASPLSSHCFPISVPLPASVCSFLCLFSVFCLPIFSSLSSLVYPLIHLLACLSHLLSVRFCVFSPYQLPAPVLLRCVSHRYTRLTSLETLLSSQWCHPALEGWIQLSLSMAQPRLYQQ